MSVDSFILQSDNRYRLLITGEVHVIKYGTTYNNGYRNSGIFRTIKFFVRMHVYEN